MKKHSTRERIYHLLAPARAGDRASAWVDGALMAAIVVSVAGLVIETMPDLRPGALRFLRWVEIVTVAIFTVEYALRLWSCTFDPRYRGLVSGRLRFAVRPLMIVDLLAIVPFYLPMLPVDLRFLRVARMFRLLRLLKLARYSAALRLLGRVLLNSREELITVVLVLGALLLGASSLMYYAEHEAQPDDFSSIPETMWWAVVTLTTVGYGDAVPITLWGRLLGAVIAILGIGMFALPAGILGSGFVEEVRRQKRSGAAHCPHCGEAIE